MKNLMLVSLLACSASIAQAQTFKQTFHDLTHNRLASGVKSAACLYLSWIAANKSLDAFNNWTLLNGTDSQTNAENTFVKNLGGTIKSSLKSNKFNTVAKGVESFGLGWVACVLARKSIAYGKHALAVR